MLEYCYIIWPIIITKICNKRIFAGHAIAMVIYCVTKMITARSPMVRQYFDTIIVASSNKEWL